jgi:hypothetical protein
MVQSPWPYGSVNHFIDGLDFPTTPFNNLGSPAFGPGNVASVNASGQPAGSTAVARHPFAEPLAVGDVFSAEFDSPAEYDDYSAQGFSLCHHWLQGCGWDGNVQHRGWIVRAVW